MAVPRHRVAAPSRSLGLCLAVAVAGDVAAWLAYLLNGNATAIVYVYLAVAPLLLGWRLARHWHGWCWLAAFVISAVVTLICWVPLLIATAVVLADLKWIPALGQ